MGFPDIKSEENAPLRITSEWEDGEIFRWYRDRAARSPDAIAIDTLQIRKETVVGLPCHRFVLLYMRDRSVHRLDRRPDQRAVEVLVNTAVPTKDELLHDLDQTALDHIHKTTKHEIGLFLEGQVDIEVVLSACNAISIDKSACKYTFFEHNCFFFSWTILMVASRSYLPYEVPAHDPISERAASCIPRLAEFIVDEIVEILLEFVIDALTVFRKKAGPSIHQGMHILARTGWALPIDVLRFSWKQMFKARLHFGLRKRLEAQISEMLKKTIVDLCRNALVHHNTPVLVDGHLWLNRLSVILVPAIRTEMIHREKGAIFSAISGGLGDIDPSEFAKGVVDPSLKFAFLGKRAAQFHAVWNASLNGALKAAKDVVDCTEWVDWWKRWHHDFEDLEKQPDKSPEEIARDVAEHGRKCVRKHYETVFDMTWNVARDGALESAKAIVKETQGSMKHKEARDRMWCEIWAIWDDLWAEVHPGAREKAVDAMDRIVQKMINTSVELITSELGDSKVHFVLARIPGNDLYDEIEESGNPHPSQDIQLAKENMNNETLQEFMKKKMRRGIISEDKFEVVIDTMSSVWAQVVKR
ncbi:hypothetical protein VNI00_016593 [Paramarasmius palmivorus]|uniref:Uncharacterized protein n=1 Tax=Paramarasmius palmivorus TaxID=297713 RepID=A0AAW0BCE0_9AGAR